MAQAYKQDWTGSTIGYSYYGFTVNSVANSILSITTQNGDPYINMNGLGSFNPDVYKFIEFRWRAGAGVNIGQVQLYFLNSSYPSATESQVVLSPGLVGTGGWVTTAVYMGNHANWDSARGYITGWRFDVGQIGGVTIDIDYILLRDNTPPNAPVITYPPYGSVINTTTPTMAWTFSDPDPGAYQSYYLIELVNEAYNSVLWTTLWSPSSATSFTLPSGKMANGLKYYLRMKVQDEYGAINSASTQGVGDASYAHTFFTVDISPPVIGSVIAQQYVSSGKTATFWAYNVTDNVAVSYMTAYMVRPDGTYFEIAQPTRNGSTANWYVSYTFPVGEQEGNWRCDFRAIDTAANVSALGLAYAYYDKTLPTLTPPADQTVTSPSSNTGSVSLTAVATDTGSGLKEVVVRFRKSTDNGKTYGNWSAFAAASAGSNNQYTVAFNRSSPNGFGMYQFEWNATDLALNTKSAVYSIYNIQSGLATVGATGTSNVTATTAFSSGIASTLDGGLLQQYGHVWSTTALPTTAVATKTTLGTSLSMNATYNSSLTGLTPGTTYYVRSYVTTQYGTTYGTQASFATPKLAQTAPTPPTASFITGSSMVWMSSETAMIVCNGETQPSGSIWSGLKANTAYTAYAYLPATDSLLQSPNSGNASATTLYDFPIAATLPPVTSGNRVMISGNLVDTGGGVTQHGHVWSTSPGPTIALATKTSLNLRSNTGEFRSSVRGLLKDTTYYIRAYATNSIGTSYGVEYTFTVNGVVARLKKSSLALLGNLNERAPRVANPVVYYPLDGTPDGYTSTYATLTENNLKDYGEFYLPIDAPTFSSQGCYFNGNNTCYLRTTRDNIPFSLIFNKNNEFLDVEIEFNPDAIGAYALTSFYSGYNYASQFLYSIRLLANGTMWASVGCAAKNPTEYQNRGWSINTTGTTVIKAGTWNKVRITYDKETLNLYVNGALDSQAYALNDVSLETTLGNGVWQTYRQKDLRDTWNTVLFIGADGAYAPNVTHVSSPLNDPIARVPAWNGYNSFKGYLRNFKITQAAPIQLGSDSSVTNQGLLVEEMRTNVVRNTDMVTGWDQGYMTDIRLNEIPPPEGIDSPVIGFTSKDVTNGGGWYHSYGDYAMQEDVSDYTPSVYLKVEAETRIQVLTAAAGEQHGKWTNQVTVRPEDGWKRVIFNSFRTEVDNDSDSMSFVLNFPPKKRVWLCAPQMEKRPFGTSFIFDSSSFSYGPTKLPFRFKLPLTISLNYEVDSKVISGSEQALFSFDQGDSDMNTFGLFRLGDGRFRVRTGSSSSSYQEIFALPVADGVHNFVVTLTTTSVALWIDGVSVASLSTGTMPVPTIVPEYMRIGNGIEQDLVTNGSAQLGTNVNFSSFTYMTGDSYDSSNTSCFYRTSAAATLFSDEYIPVNTRHMYSLSGAFKNAGTDPGRLYFGVACYDKDKKFIDHNRVTHKGNTTLAQPLKAGDTTVYLTSVANWATTTPGVYHYSKQMSWWITGNYQNYTYSDGCVGYINLDATAKTITLQNAWTGVTLPAGTAVANSTDGSGYDYIAAANPVVPTSWTRYSGTITGVGSGLSGKFRFGTKFVRILFLVNREAATTPTLRMDAIKFIDITQEGCPASRPISNVAIYDRALANNEIIALGKPTNSIKSTGDLVTTNLIEGLSGLKPSDLYYPLTVNSLDINHFNPPTVETNTIYDNNGVWTSSSYSNIYMNEAPSANNGGTVEDVSLTEPGPIPNTKTWKLVKTGTGNQWHGWESAYGGRFNCNPGDYITISGWYKVDTAVPGVSGFYFGLYTSDWARPIATAVSSDGKIIADNQWRYFYGTIQATEQAVNPIIVDGPSWGYSTGKGTMYINGLQWTRSATVPYPAPSLPSLVVSGPSVLKYSFPTILTPNNDWTVGVMAKPNLKNIIDVDITRLVPLAVGNYYVLGQSDACIGFTWSNGHVAGAWQLIGYNNTATTYVSKYGSGSLLTAEDYSDWGLYVIRYNSVTDTVAAEIHAPSGAIYSSIVTGQPMTGLDPVVRLGGYSWDECSWDGYLKNFFIVPRLMTTDEINKMWKAKMRLNKSGEAKVQGNIIEGQVF